MATLEGRDGTALIVIDVQNAVVEGAYERDATIGRIGDVVARAREVGVPVVWVQQTDERRPEGSEGWAIVPELAPADDEVRVLKAYGDSFEDTTLESVLAGHGV